MSTTLPLFWHLSSASKNERLDASVKLISALEHFQSQKAAPAPSAESSDDDDDQDNMTSKFKDNLDLLNAQDVSYSIRRLIRGLASPRESSRLGFAVALTELLSRLCTVTCSQVMGLIMDSTKHQGSMKGQEERDILFARLFGISSIIQSGLAVRAKPIPNSSSSENSASSLECYDQIISSLLSLGDEKSWLRESAWFTVNLAVDALHESEVAWKEKAVEKTLHTLFTTHSIWSTEKLALTLKLQDFFPERNWKGYLSPVFKNTDILSTGNLATVAKILKESATDEDRAKDPTKAPSRGWKPQLNFSWGIILDQLLPGPNSEKEPKGSFQDFYKIVVDETLFSATSSANRKYWGFQVFQNALKKADQETVPMLFTKNFMRTWINHLSKRDRYLHKIALQTATEVESFVKSKPQLGFGLILQLTGANGSQQFDKLTRTKTVESILSVLDVKGVEQYVDHLLSQANESAVHAGTDVGAINSRRAWIIDQLASIIRNQRLPRADTWIKNILDWLTVHGLFMIKKKSSKIPFPMLRTIPSPPLSDELRQTCRDKLLACLGDLCHQVVVVTEGESTRKIPGVASDGEFWLSKVLSDIRLLEQNAKHTVLLEEADEETIGLRVKARETLDALKTSNAGQEATKGAELLLLGTLLIHFCKVDDDSVEAADPLEACIDGVARLLLSEARKKGEDSESEPVDLLVDTIIGFLEKGTSFTRSIGNLSFGLLSELIKESTIDLILMQLERREPSQLLGEDEDDEMEVAENVGSEDEGSDSDESKTSDSEDSHDPSSDEEADPELRRKIEEALRINGIDPATGETDSEEELMDDDQMIAIDEQLAQVFRARANEKKGKNLDAHREATHFKSRVLDLVDTYLKKEPTSPLALCFISPLVELAIASGQDERQLADKAKGILRSRLGKAKESVNGADPAQILEISTNVHTMARRARSSDNLAVLSLCAIYLAKASIHAGHEESLVDLYKEDLRDFTRRKKSGLNGAFFQEFIKKYPSCGWRLREDLLDVLKGAINTYRQIQVIQLLQLLLSISTSFNVSEDEVKTFMPLLRQQLLEIAEDACTDSGNLTTAQMKEVLKLVLLGVRQTARIAIMATDSLWKSDTWRSLIETLGTSPRFKSSPVLKKLCECIARTTDSSGLEQSKKKRKADVLEANHQNSKKKHKLDS